MSTFTSREHLRTEVAKYMHQGHLVGRPGSLWLSNYKTSIEALNFGGGGGGSQGSSKRRSQVFVKLSFIYFFFIFLIFFFWGGGGGSGRGGGGGQGRCERRSEVFVKIQKKMGVVWSGRGGRIRGGVRVGVNEEVKFL